MEQQGKILEKEAFELFFTFVGKFWVFFPTTTSPDFLTQINFDIIFLKFSFIPIEKIKGMGEKNPFFFCCLSKIIFLREAYFC